MTALSLSLQNITKYLKHNIVYHLAYQQQLIQFNNIKAQLAIGILNAKLSHNYVMYYCT